MNEVGAYIGSNPVLTTKVNDNEKFFKTTIQQKNKNYAREKSKISKGYIR